MRPLPLFARTIRIIASLSIFAGLTFAQSGVIATYAGNGTSAYTGDGVAATATGMRPFGLALDANGNLYIADSQNARILRVDASTGLVTTAAGGGTGGDGVLATASQLTAPCDVKIDASGNLYISDSCEQASGGGGATSTLMNRIRRVDAVTGIITTIAGSNGSGFSGDGGPAVNALLNVPGGLAIDGSGNIYIADSGNYRVRRIDAGTGVITTFAGNGSGVFAGDAGPATMAGVWPISLAFDAAGNLYVGDGGSNNRIRRIDASTGIITTVAGTGTQLFNGDGIPANTANLTVGINLAVDAQGKLTFPDPFNNRVRIVDPLSGLIWTVAGNGLISGQSNGQAALVKLTTPIGVALSPSGTLFISDFENLVREIASPIPSTAITVTTSGTTSPLTFTTTLTSINGQAANTGAVEIVVDGGASFVCCASMVNGVATLTSSSLTGTHTFYAYYDNGEPAFGPSVSLPLSVTITMPPTTITLTASPNPAQTTQAVTLTASVTPVPAGATVTFLNAGMPIGTVSTANGIATFNAGTFTPGTYTFTATISGVINSQPVTLVVKGSPAVTLTTTPNPSVVGAAVTLTATLTPATATGTVSFQDGATVLGTGTLANGSASISATFTTQGSHSITALYSGDANNAASTSGPLQQTVNKVSTTTSLNGSVAVSTLGNAVTFTATVSPTSATGTVQFSAFATNSGSSYSLGSAPVVSGVATLTTTALVSGPNAVTAIYSGDSQNAGSTSAAFNEMVRFASGTGLTSSLNPSTSGASVTLTATVFPPNSGQTGSVQFFNGSVLLGTSALSAGLTAQLITTALPVGTDSLTAVYSGDTVWAGSTSTVLSQTVNKVVTTTTLISSLNPSTVGASVTFTATVSPATATGTVQFFDGATVLATSNLASGSASFTTTSLTQGTHSITAVYSGDANNATATSAATSQVVKGTTTVALISSLNPAIVGQSVVFTATVNSAATGTVQFLDGATVLGTGTVSSGVATFATTTLAQGTHSISANYSGDTNYASASSAPLTETVNAKTTTTTALVPLGGSPNPSNPGTLVGFTATVSPSTATGTVQFLDGATVLATLPLSGGSVSFNFQLSTSGQHLITAVYGGDSSDLGSTSAAYTQTVRNATTVSLSSSQNPSLAGGAVTFVAVVSPSTATGTVQFQDGATALGAANLSGGMASFSTALLAQGTHTITAVYGGDTNDAVATSNAISQVVNAKTTTTTTVSSSVNPSTVGQSVKFTATVSPTSATGTVQFLDGSNVIGTATLASGSASFTTTTLAQGAHSITASYSGDAADNASISSTLTQTVNVAAPAAPSSLTATDAGSSQINLTWTASATSGVTYDVYRSTTSGFTPSASTRIATGVTTPSYSATGLSGSTTYYFRVSAVNAGGESADTNQATATTSAALSCHVSYSVTTQWPGGFGGAYTIKNTGTTPINGWTLTWTWPGSQTVTQAWDATYSQHGANVSFTNESFDATIAPGKTLSGMGFNGTWSGSNVAPTAFYLNGSLCQ